MGKKAPLSTATATGSVSTSVTRTACPNTAVTALAGHRRTALVTASPGPTRKKKAHVFTTHGHVVVRTGATAHHATRGVDVGPGVPISGSVGPNLVDYLSTMGSGNPGIRSPGNTPSGSFVVTRSRGPHPIVKYIPKKEGAKKPSLVASSSPSAGISTIHASMTNTCLKLNIDRPREG